jgi:alpha-ketoglutarate-dependent taurine dioxygenase
MIVEKLAPFGARVSGIDLRRAAPADLVGRLESLILEHSFLVFEPQRLTKRELVAFTTTFGPAQAHVIGYNRDNEIPEVTEIGQREENGKRIYADLGARFWHTDGSTSSKPITYTALYAVTLPTAGGNTEMADQCAAFEALGDERKTRLEAMTAIHDLRFSVEFTARDMTEEQRAARMLTEEEKRRIKPIEQPVVRVHPITGRKALYVSYSQTSHIVGMPFEDGRELIRELVDWGAQSRFVYSHAWKTGELLIWDNRCTMHRGRPYPDGENRTMWRTSHLAHGYNDAA